MLLRLRLIAPLVVFFAAVVAALSSNTNPTTQSTTPRQQCVMASKEEDMNRAYQIRPLTKHFGVEVLGNVDLSRVDLSDESPVLLQLKQDLIKHRVVLFRQQHLSGQRQVDISNCLGQVESTFYKHPQSPHPDIFRVSNVEEEGCTHVGRSGWHVDGTFQMRPFMYQTMYFSSVAQGGDTYFIPLHELYESLPPETQQRYDGLWMVTDRRQAPVHPLVYQHPFRNETTMLFHCGKPFVRGWLQDYDEEEEDGTTTTRHVNVQQMIPSWPIQQELTNEIESRLNDLGLRMKWQQGDFMINDNLGLAHYASPGTQEDAQQVGLRILHRTTIVGGPETVPQKADGRKSFTLL